jgi:hypothetical protein
MQKVSISGCFGTVTMVLCLTSDGCLALSVVLNGGTEQIIGRYPLPGVQVCIADLRQMLKNVRVVHRRTDVSIKSGFMEFFITGDLRVTDVAMMVRPYFRFTVPAQPKYDVHYGHLRRDHFFPRVDIWLRREIRAQEHTQQLSFPDWEILAGQTDLVSYLNRRSVGMVDKILFPQDDNDEDSSES